MANKFKDVSANWSIWKPNYTLSNLNEYLVRCNHCNKFYNWLKTIKSGYSLYNSECPHCAGRLYTKRENEI